MSETIVRQWRRSGDLLLWIDTRKGWHLDQGNDQHTITVPSGGRVRDAGLYTEGNAFTISSFDIAAPNFWAVVFLQNLQWSAGEKTILELGSDSGSSNSGFRVYMNGTTGIVGSHRFGDGVSSCTLAPLNNGECLASFQFDRRHPALSVIGFYHGIYSVATVANSGVPGNDFYGEDTLYMMAKSDNTLRVDCAVPVIGIGRGYLSHTQHAALAAEILERKTC